MDADLLMDRERKKMKLRQKITTVWKNLIDVVGIRISPNTSGRTSQVHITIPSRISRRLSYPEAVALQKSFIHAGILSFMH